MAVTAFTELADMDPYRLENMDYFSNTLYIKVRTTSQTPCTSR